MIKIQKHKKVIALVIALVLCIAPLIYKPVDANAAAKAPVIVTPAQYTECLLGHDVRIEWTHSGDEPDEYLINVRALSVGNNPNYNTLIVQNRTTQNLFTIIEADRLSSCSVYRVSVAAVYGSTKKYSNEVYFFASTYDVNDIDHPISFKIWTGFETATKNAIYYATQTWNNEIGFEAVNTYPFSNGYETNDIVNDSVNAIVGKSVGTGTYTMKTFSYSRNGKTCGFDININKSHSWANSAQSGKYDVQSIMAHEIGQVLGLSHKYEDFAVDWTMYGTGAKNSIKGRSLEQVDKDCLADLY